MKFTQDMMLQSDSGLCMPFEEKRKRALRCHLVASRNILRRRCYSSIMVLTLPVQHYLPLLCHWKGEVSGNRQMMLSMASIRSSDMAGMR